MSDIPYIVYCHREISTNKCYVGITKQTASDRWKNGSGYKRQAFYNVIQEVGWDSFEHTVLLEELTKEEAEYFETFFIDYFDSCENGYNVDYAEGPINAMCGEYYRDNNIVIEPKRLIELYRTRGSIDLEILEMVDNALKKLDTK